MRNSKIILAKNINIDKNYTNVLDYTEQQMLNLCQKNQVATADDFSFIRNQNKIQTGFNYNTCLQANYIAFQNPNYSNKWFFAWIDEVIYKGDSNTEIDFTVDSWSTWFDRWKAKPCFVSREHVNDDTIGKHTIPENLDVGDMIQESVETELDLKKICFCLLTTYDPVSDEDFVGVTKYNNQLFGYEIVIFDLSKTNEIDIENFIQATNAKSKIDSILAIFACPLEMFSTTTLEQKEGKYTTATYHYQIVSTDQVTTGEITKSCLSYAFLFSKTNSFSDYTPKNNKCFTYPYNFLQVTNNVGNYNNYKYELFDSENPQFEIQMSFSIGMSIRAVPRGYKGIDYNNDESLPLGKFPTFSWASDAFINWLTQNAVNVGTSLVSTGISAVTGNTGTTSGNIANLIGQFYQASLMPSIEGGNNTGDVNFSNGDNTFKFIHLRCKNENMKIIDNYFSRFGYKVNELKVPNITGRKYWNYIEIAPSEEIGYGDVPSKYMEIINNACRKGITIWHNHDNVGNYNLDNSII